MKHKKFSLSRIYRQIKPELKPYWWYVFGALSLSAISFFILSVLLPKLFQEFIDFVYAGDAVSARQAFIAIVLPFALNFLIIARASGLMITISQSKIMKALADKFMHSTLYRSRDFFASSFSGRLVARWKRYITGFETVYNITIYNIASVVILVTGSAVFLYRENQELGLYMLLWFVIYLTFALLSQKYRIRLSLKKAAQESILTGLVSDLITNSLALKIFSAEKREMSQFERVSDSLERKRRRLWLYGDLTGFINAILRNGFILFLTGFAFHQWTLALVGPGVILLAWQYSRLLSKYVWRFTKNINRLTSALADMHEATILLDEPL